MPRNQEQSGQGQGRGSQGMGGQSQGHQGMGGQRKTSPAEIEKSLKGLDYPAEKDELIQHARSHNAPSDVIQCLEQIPDKEYNSPTDVAQGLRNLL